MENLNNTAKTSSRYGYLIWGAMAMGALLVNTNSAKAEHARDWRVTDIKDTKEPRREGMACAQARRNYSSRYGSQNRSKRTCYYGPARRLT